MNKKKAYCAYYYSTVDETTPAQLKNTTELPSVDVSKVETWMGENSIFALIDGNIDFHWRIQQVTPRPYILYYQGDISLLDKATISIVGPRMMSGYAQQILKDLFTDIQYVDIVTVSGMAPGVDMLCHELSLQYNIPTIAVLGGGFEYFLSGTKREMMKRIVDGGGLILSEYKHSFRPTVRSFPQRNRIIAGIADVIFLPEAKEKSGSLLTADEGYKIQKPIYAPMNSIYAESAKGTNQYIAVGRISPLTELRGFLEKHFECREKSREQRAESIDIGQGLNEEEKTIVAILAELGECSMSQLEERCGYSSQQILAVMTMLEMKELIVQKGPGVYTLIKNKSR